MKLNRAAGILLHLTSLPGPDGIGDLGPQAREWVDFLADTGCTLWQVLSLGPTGYGDSPYQCFSAFAGNPYLVSPALLLDEGLLSPANLADRPSLPWDRVDYGRVIPWKLTLLDRAFACFQSSASAELQTKFETFQADQAAWLDDFALFMTLKEMHGGQSWDNWPAPLRRRELQALGKIRRTHAESIQRHAFRQFLFFRQWLALRTYTTQKKICLVGDIPIFVAYDSADVWAHPELFHLDEELQPTIVAGVPPDYFSPTGQLWGNPIYRWDLMETQGYAWWIDRVRHNFSLVDLLRIDHFRGFEAYWEVPAGESTAINGRWTKGPDAKLFYALQDTLGELPIIAEDLGVLTPEVIALRNRFDFPGMKVLQFAFDSDATNPDLPFNYDHKFVVYTGTHDNNTTLGWYRSRSEEIKHKVRLYLGVDGHDISWDLIRLALSSVADTAITPLQDILGLGSEARMNFPGKPSGNWQWRYSPSALENNEWLIPRLQTLIELYGRQGWKRDETGNLGEWRKQTEAKTDVASLTAPTP